jgi:hypothetical protein
MGRANPMKQAATLKRCSDYRWLRRAIWRGELLSTRVLAKQLTGGRRDPDVNSLYAHS